MDASAIPPPPPIAPRPGANADEAAIRKVAAEFEAMVLGELLQPMFENLDSDGMFGGGSAERMFRPMLVEQYAQRIAQTGGIGLTDAIAAEMIRMQSNIEPSEE